MKKYITYIKYVLKHKYYVFIYGRMLKVPLWQLIIHDISKFSPSELSAYVEWFGREEMSKTERTIAKNKFDYAWLHHIHHNKHHWNYWIYSSDNDGIQVLRMEERYLREMIADWMSVGMVLRGTPENAKKWYLETKHTMALHPQTRSRIEFLLGITPAKPSIETVEPPTYRMPGS